MKLRVVDRLLAALVGIVLLCMALIPLADGIGIFQVGILTRLADFAADKAHRLILIGGGVLLILLGLGALHLACRRKKHKGFVVQTTDAGELSISVRAIQDLVDRCVDKHDELHVTSAMMDTTRDGVVISLRVGLAAGVNIPLAVSALQKQIKQYVTACSGVDVQEVKVQVDATTPKAKASVYAVPEALENPPALPREEAAPEEPKPAEPKEEKCLHQRLFSEEEQPAIVPMPPAAAEPEAQEEPEAPEEVEEPEVLEEPEEPIEPDEYQVDEESVAELAALDGADEVPADDEQEKEEQ